MATMNISLPDKLKEFVELRVAEGGFSNASDYMRDLIRKEQSRAQYIREMNEAVAEGYASGFHEAELEELFESVFKDTEVVEKKSAREFDIPQKPTSTLSR